MRVICISKDRPGEHADLIIAAAMLEVGSMYTVIDEDETRYELAEFPHPLHIMWDKIHFATLPDNTSDEMQEAEKEAIINLETELA